MITNNRNDSLKAIVSSFNLLPNLARDFKTIRRSLSKITGIKPSITEGIARPSIEYIANSLYSFDRKFVIEVSLIIDIYMLKDKVCFYSMITKLILPL